MDNQVNCCNAAESSKKANCDQEAWVKRTIFKALLMAVSISRISNTGQIYLGALDGIAEGAAIEVIRDLGMEPEFANLKRREFTDPLIRNQLATP